MRTGRKPDFPGKPLRKLVYFLESGPTRLIFLIACLVFPVSIALGSWSDGTWVMPAPNKGFSQYYGFWVIFATAPVIILLTSHLFDSFKNLIENPKKYCVNLTQETATQLERLTRRHIRSLELRSSTGWVLTFVMVTFLMWWIFNCISTISPTPLRTFHHDVFDSSAHPAGYFIVRCYTLLLFVFIYAPAVFLALHVTVSMISVLKFLCSRNALYINFFHEDNCGGTSEFGKINLLILSIYGSFFAIIYAQYLTHRQAYLVIMVSLIACSVLATTQSIAAVYYIHQFIVRKKHECIGELSTRLNEQLTPTLGGNPFPSDLLAFRKHIMELHTFPYSEEALIAVNVIRFAPAALAVISLFKRI